ncbi:MAG: response regulator [Agriterribacter sp.]
MLLVEDNEMNTLLASAILSRTGANITEAGNGKEAIEFLRQKPFDVILMDLHLPVMNGLDTTKYIRKELMLDVPIIAITANILNDEENRCLEAGMNAFISKPYTEKNLVEKISYVYHIAKSKKEDQCSSSSPEIDLFDLNTLKVITRGNEELMRTMLKAFINQVPVSIYALKTALKEKNFIEIHAAAHNIKPNIDTLEITTLKTIIRQIELLASQQKDIEELEHLITMLESVLTKVVAQLKLRENI